MIYLNIVVVKSSVVSGEERYGGYVRKGIGTMELEVDEMLVELRQNAEYTDNYDIASDNHLVYIGMSKIESSNRNYCRKYIVKITDMCYHLNI